MDDLEIKKFYGSRQKNWNEDRPILSAAKCRPMILVSRNMRYIRIFAGVLSGNGVKFKYNKCYVYVHTLNISFE